MMTPDQLRDLQGRGWRVMPIPAGQKFPPPAGWQIDDRVYSEDEMAAWPGNAAVKAGLSCLVIVDLDEYKAGYRAEEVAALGLPETFEVRSPRGGRHLYYEVPGGIDESATLVPSTNTLGWEGFDVRAGKSYVVSPGSFAEGGAYQVIRNVPPAPAPEVIMALARNGRVAGLADASSEEVGLNWAAEIERAKHLQSGTQNEALLRFCASLRSAGLTDRQAVGLIHMFMRNLVNWDPSDPWTPDFGLEMWRRTKARIDAPTAIDADLMEWATGGGTPTPEALGYVDFEDESFWKPAPPVWFVPGMLIEGEVCTIYSAGGQGKSLLAQDITLGLVARGTVFGETVELQDVLYLDRENSARGLSKRFRDMGHSGPLPRLHYSLLGQWPPLDTAAGGQALLAEVKRTGARLVVLDTMSKMVDGEENANDTWNGLHSHSMVALKKAGVTVIQLDHTGKDQDKGQRGGSSKQNNADVIWKLSYADGYVTLRNEKDREGGYEKLVYLERQEVPVLVHRPTTATPVAVAAAVAEADLIEEIVQMIDLLELPRTAGRPACEEALRRAYPDKKFKTERLSKAVKIRKETL